ncbi:MAG: glycosyl hydrolase [Nocardioidaceae bacterium]
MRSPRAVVAVVAVTIVVVLVAGALLWRQHLRPGDPSGRGPSGPWFGFEVPGAEVAKVDDLADRLGCRPAVMSRFVKLDSNLQVSDLQQMAAQGRMPLLTLEPWSWRSRPGSVEPRFSLQSIVEGRHDEDLWRIGSVIEQYGGPVMLRFAHEMNANWYPWGMGVNENTPDRYVAAWDHVHALIERTGADVSWVWSPVAAWWPDAVPLRDLYPGDDEVDVVAASGYGRRDLASTMSDTFAAWHHEVRRFTDKPAIIAETGADEAVRDAYLDDLGEFFDRYPDVDGFVWFDTSPESTGATGRYEVSDTQEHLDQFRTALRNAHVACGPAD